MKKDKGKKERKKKKKGEDARNEARVGRFEGAVRGIHLGPSTAHTFKRSLEHDAVQRYVALLLTFWTWVFTRLIVLSQDHVKGSTFCNSKGEDSRSEGSS